MYEKIKTWVCDNIHFVHMDYHNINFYSYHLFL